MTLGGLLYAAYSIPPVIALPNMDNSSNIIDMTLSFSMSLQMLMTASLGFAVPRAQLSNETPLNSLPRRLGFPVPPSWNPPLPSS